MSRFATNSLAAFASIALFAVSLGALIIVPADPGLAAHADLVSAPALA